MLDLLAVCVVDHVFEIDVGTRRRTHAQDLVGAHAEVAVRQTLVLRRAQAQQPARLVEHDEVVAGALHFGEMNLHGAIIRSPPARSALPVTPALHFFAAGLSPQHRLLPLNGQRRIYLTSTAELSQSASVSGAVSCQCLYP